MEVSVEEVEKNLLDKQIILNKIIAAGLNSLNTGIQTDKDLLDAFATQSFDEILSCWDHLRDGIQFHIFKTHVTEFGKFMREKSEAKK